MAMGGETGPRAPRWKEYFFAVGVHPGKAGSGFSHAHFGTPCGWAFPWAANWTLTKWNGFGLKPSFRPSPRTWGRETCPTRGGSRPTRSPAPRAATLDRRSWRASGPGSRAAPVVPRGGSRVSPRGSRRAVACRGPGRAAAHGVAESRRGRIHGPGDAPDPASKAAPGAGAVPRGRAGGPGPRLRQFWFDAFPARRLPRDKVTFR